MSLKLNADALLNGFSEEFRFAFRVLAKIWRNVKSRIGRSHFFIVYDRYLYGSFVMVVLKQNLDVSFTVR